ncbi:MULTISPECIES: hypothetical protein [unclassified Haladaptatus]|uniref:hypothetical protein n=1 Tax=unclassified Haladaptatus TaxID=2622732 RepID=UPI0023E77476|nr:MULTISPECIES: hypothetical protein [unclassified Haladaptatus]
MTDSFADTLPNNPVPASLANDIEALDGVEQCVAVRGHYEGEELAYQLLVNIVGRGVLAVHFAEDDGWRVVYDSAREDSEETDDETVYRHAHDALYRLAPEDPDSNHYETTPPEWAPPEER